MQLSFTLGLSLAEVSSSYPRFSLFPRSMADPPDADSIN
jgi:hypothetical protein